MIFARVIYSLLCLCMLLALAPGMGQALYHNGEKYDEFSFHKERSYTSWNQGEKKLALYDNFNTFSAKHRPKSILHPYSNRFAWIDLIDCNIPIFITIRSAVTAEEALSNLFYANIKLRKIYTEIEALKRRSRDLLTDLDIPFVEVNHSFTEQIDVNPNSSRKLKFDLKTSSNEKYKASVKQEKMMLGNRIQTVTRSTGLFTIRDSHRNIGLVLSLRDNAQRLDSLVPDPFKVHSKKTTGGLLIASNEESWVGQSNSASHKRRLPRRKRSSSDSINPQPKAIKIVFGIQRYITTHKGEALMFGIILFLGFYFLSSLRSRR